MPLIKSTSKKAFGKNVAKEMNAGKPQKQALAVAFATKRRAKKMAKGGDVQASPTPTPDPKIQKDADDVQLLLNRQKELLDQDNKPAPYAEGGNVKTRKQRALEAFHGSKMMAEGGMATNDGYQSSCDAHCVQPCQVHPQAEPNEEEFNKSHPMKSSKPSMMEDDRSLNQHGEIEVGPEGAYADGGDVMPEDMYSKFNRLEDEAGISHPAESDLSIYTRQTQAQMAADQDMDNRREIEDKANKAEDGYWHPDMKAEGGYITDNEQDDSHEMDMVGRIMKQRQQSFSQGGKVANSSHGVNDSKLAGFSPNEFDELALNDDLESSYTGANSGDELGNKREDINREDIITKIMRSRAKRDRLPNPR